MLEEEEAVYVYPYVANKDPNALGLLYQVDLPPAYKVAKQAGAEAGRAGAASLSFRASDPTDLGSTGIIVFKQ